MKEHTYHSCTWTGRTAGSRHFSSSCSCSQDGTCRKNTGVSRRTLQSAYPVDLWTALRVSGVLCLHLHCLHLVFGLVDGSSASPALAVSGSSLLAVSRGFPLLALCFFPCRIFYWINLNKSELWTAYSPWGLCVLWAPPPESCSIYMLWGIQGVNRRIPTRSSVAIAGSSNGASRVTARESQDGRQAWSLYRHWRISVRWQRKHRAVIERRLPDLCSIACGFLPLHFRRWPTDRCSGIGQCPMGRRRMRKSGEASGGRRANFNCELNLQGHRRMSVGWVLNRRITPGFLQDSSHGSPCADPAIDFALLWRRY